MSERDLGNQTTEKIYKLATEPVFAADNNPLEPASISWEVSDGVPEELPLEKEDTSDISAENSPLEDSQQDTNLPDDSLEDKEEESEEEKEKIKKKNRTSERKRIADLNRQLKQAQAVARDVLTHNKYLENKLTQKQKEALETEENLLKSQKERVKLYLTEAIEEGDPAKIAEAHDMLSQYNAEIQLKKSHKTNIVSPSVNNYQQEILPPENFYPEDQGEGLEWVERNSWANTQSPDFDEELYNFADQYSVKLAKKYVLQGKKSQIGSAQFWDEITNYMNNTFEVNVETPQISHESSPSNKFPQRSRTPMKSHPSNTIAPTREPMTGGNTVKPNQIVLTPEQRQAAHSMSGYVRDPKTGQKVTDLRMLEEIYKRNMRGV